MFAINLKVALASHRVKCFTKKFRDLEGLRRVSPFFLYDIILLPYVTIRLCLAKRELFALLRTVSVLKCTDLSLLLWVGELLYGTGEYKYSIVCFNRVIEGLDHDDQDIRLKALTGRLESELATKLQNIINGRADPKGYAEAKHSYGIIVRDLYALNPEAQLSLKKRLEQITKSMGILAIGNSYYRGFS